MPSEDEITASSERRIGTPFSLHVSVYIISSYTMQRGVRYGIRYPKSDGKKLICTGEPVTGCILIELVDESFHGTYVRVKPN